MPSLVFKLPRDYDGQLTPCLEDPAVFIIREFSFTITLHHPKKKKKKVYESTRSNQAQAMSVVPDEPHILTRMFTHSSSGTCVRRRSRFCYSGWVFFISRSNENTCSNQALAQNVLPIPDIGTTNDDVHGTRSEHRNSHATVQTGKTTPAA